MICVIFICKWLSFSMNQMLRGCVCHSATFEIISAICFGGFKHQQILVLLTTSTLRLRVLSRDNSVSSKEPVRIQSSPQSITYFADFCAKNKMLDDTRIFFLKPKESAMKFNFVPEYFGLNSIFFYLNRKNLQCKLCP